MGRASACMSIMERNCWRALLRIETISNTNCWWARLYNAGVNATVLQEVFGYDRKTMKKVGGGVCSGGRGPETGSRIGRDEALGEKLTPEIQRYVRMRFPAIYQETQYDYSKRMRERDRTRVWRKRCLVRPCARC